MKLRPVKPKKHKRVAVAAKDGWSWLCAARVLRSNAFPSLDDLSTDDEGSEIGFASPLSESPCAVFIPRPDQELERVYEFSLSQEALFVARLVIETPAEAADFICAPIGNHVTRVKLMRYLRKQLGWPSHRVRGTFNELAEFVGDLER